MKATFFVISAVIYELTPFLLALAFVFYPFPNLLDAENLLIKMLFVVGLLTQFLAIGIRAYFEKHKEKDEERYYRIRFRSDIVMIVLSVAAIVFIWNVLNPNFYALLRQVPPTEAPPHGIGEVYFFLWALTVLYGVTGFKFFADLAEILD